MGGQMYFGTKNKMAWVPAAKISLDRSLTTWSNTKNFYNGGASVRNSKAGARAYNMEWPLDSGTNLSFIYGCADRAYGDGPFYFVDPDAANYNLFPQYFACPLLGAKDAPLLYGTVRPTLVTTATNTQMYPIQSAVYTTTGVGAAFMWFPVPSGWTLSLGYHGAASTGTSVVEAVTDAAVVTPLTVLGNNTTTRTNYTYAGPGGVSIRLNGTGTSTISGLIAQMRPTATATVPQGGWLPGKGNSGCEFAQYPQDELYSAAIDRSHVSAVMQEVGAWL